jgi:hypothetical protein
MKVFIFYFITIILIVYVSSSFCYKNARKDICLDTILDSPDTQCCFYNDECIETNKEQYILGTNDIYKGIRRELAGFYLLTNEKQFFNGECKNANISWTKENLTFSKEDNQIFGDNNYCLNYHDKVVNGKTTIKSEATCLKADVLDSSKNLGIECAYYEVTIKRELYGSKKLQTCFLFDSNIVNALSSSTEIDYVTNVTFNLILADLSIDNIYSSYTIDIFPSNLYKLSYDSETGNMTIEYMFSKLILPSKFLYLLILCLF